MIFFVSLPLFLEENQFNAINMLYGITVGLGKVYVFIASCVSSQKITLVTNFSPAFLNYCPFIRVLGKHAVAIRVAGFGGQLRISWQGKGDREKRY